MTAQNTLFLTPSVATTPNNVADPTNCEWVATFDPAEYYQLEQQLVASYSLNNGNVLNIFNDLDFTQWSVYVMAVQGDCALHVTDGSGDAYLGGHGNKTFPGYVILSTSGLTNLKLECFTDNTFVQLFAGKAVEDGA